MKNKELIPCEQKQCGYMTNGGCKKCETCKAEPLKIDPRCETCFSCENKPGFVRWDDKNLKKQQKDFEKFRQEFKQFFDKLMAERKSEVKTEIKPIEKNLK
jgi:hypothetical protein